MVTKKWGSFCEKVWYRPMAWPWPVVCGACTPARTTWRPGRRHGTLEAVFEVLTKTHFSGYILLESENAGLTDFAFSRGLFQDVCTDADEFVRKGLKFL
jgi:hypothetical protein